MFGLFKPKLPIPPDEFEWLLACFKWLASEFEGMDRLAKTPLILPNRDYFPSTPLEGHRKAQFYFDLVKTHADMSEWECDLVAGETQRETRVTTGHAIQHRGDAPPLGTFSQSGERVVISYSPSELERPESLIATFAHELAHFLNHTAVSLPPGGEDLEEHATDVCAVFLGFGIFLTNTAKSFSQFQDAGEQGWEIRRQGYLNELSLVTALAVFVRLTESDVASAEAALKDYLRKPFRKALAAIDREHHTLAESVLAIDLSEWA